MVIQEVANKLVSLCVTLNEYPHVRYNQASVVGNAIANLVQQGLNVRTTTTSSPSGDEEEEDLCVCVGGGSVG